MENFAEFTKKDKVITIEMSGSPKEFGFSTKEVFLNELEPFGFVHGKMSKKNNKVDILVVGSLDSTSNKTKLAKELGVDIKTYGDIAELYEIDGDL